MSSVDLGPLIHGTTDRPYPGLRAFQRGERFIYFGRDEQVDQLLGRLAGSRFLAVVGASGSGKSSLIRAGLIDALETGFMTKAGARWRIATMRPGDHPLRNLAEALLREGVLGTGGEPSPDDVAYRRAVLRRGPLGLLESLRESPLPAGENLLLLVDQFEEIFRYRREGDPDEADAFVALLLASSRQDEVPIHVVLTMRSDFLGECAVFLDLPETLNDTQFLTPRLTREQRRQSIVAPARVFDGRVEPDLADRLLNDMGPDPDQLPLMQHALMRMWGRAARRAEPSGGDVALTLEDYEAIGQFKRALSDHADEVFKNKLDDDQRDIARTLFGCLTERSAERLDTRRPTRLAEVAAVAGRAEDWERVAAVVEVFRAPDLCFLMPPRPTPLGPDTLLDISHESLIRQWGRLREWIEREAGAAEYYRYLVKTARNWKDGRAELWGGADLDQAVAFWREQRPNPAWAERYGGAFALAAEFLKASVAKREADENREAPAIAMYDRILQTALRWEQGRAELWTGADLDDALAWIERFRPDAAWAETHGGRLDLARRFLDESQQRQHIERESKAAAEREAEARAEELRQRKNKIQWLQRFAAAASIALLVVFGLMLWAFSERSRALDLKRQAEASRTEANLSRNDAFQSRDTARRREEEARRESARATSLLLATQSQDALDKGRPVAATLFGVEAVRAAEGLDIRVRGNGRVFRRNEEILRAALNLIGGTPIHAGNEVQVDSVAFAPDGRRLAVGSGDRSVRLWEVAPRPGDEPTVLRGHESGVRSVAFAPDGRRLASGGLDGTVRLWDVAAGPDAEPAVLRGHEGWVSSVAFAPDGRRLASGGSDGTVRLWDVAAGPDAEPAVLYRHESLVLSVAFAPDGRRLASGGRDGTVRLWDLAAGLGSEPTVLRGHESGVSSVAFAPDGRRLASGGWDGTVRLWSPDVDQLIAIARRVVGRNLTREEWDQAFPDQSYRKTFEDFPEPPAAGGMP